VYDDPFDSKGEKIKESKLLIDELDLPCDFLTPSEYDSFISHDFSRVDAKPSTNNEDKVFNPSILSQEIPFEIINHVVHDKKLAISNASLVLEDFDPPFDEPLFFKEVPSSNMLLPFSSENEEKVFKLGIHTSNTSEKVHSSFIPELSHQGYKIFKINQIFKSLMNIFLISCGKDTHTLAVLCLHFYPLEQFKYGGISISKNLKTHAEGFCPPVFIFSASIRESFHHLSFSSFIFRVFDVEMLTLSSGIKSQGLVLRFPGGFFDLRSTDLVIFVLTDLIEIEIEADDQAIQTILLGPPEDIYAAVDSCETAQEIWLRVQQMMKGSDIGIQEKKAKLFNEWEMFTSYEGESIESYYHRFLKLMNDLKRNKHFPEKIASNLKFLNNLQPEWSRHVTIVHQTKDLHTADYTQLYDFLKYNQKEKEVDELKAERLAKTQDPLALMANSNNPYAFPAPHQDQPSFNQNYMQQPMPNPKDITNPTTAMNMALALMAKAFKLNYSTPTNNDQRISSNPRNRQIAQPGMNMGQDRHIQMVGGNANQNLNRNGNLVVARAKGNATGHNGNQIRCYNCKGVDLDKIEEVNANCILMANLQQALTSGTQTDKALVYDSDGSAEVHDYENCNDNEIFNMFTQEE
nr:hypothetical protein [Tanacetum cinerariifolium]